jgi:GH18 family chitinase
MNMRLGHVCSIFVAASISVAAMADTAHYSDMYISYYSPANVSAMASYVKEHKLGGMIMWELRGDAPYSTGSQDSLLNAFDTGVTGYKVGAGKAPLVMGYWDDWGLYSNDPSTRAIPEPAYPMPGSTGTTGQLVPASVTQDLSDKFSAVNAVAYSFIEAQTQSYSYYDNATKQKVTIPNKTPQDIGTLYFNDAWADLLPPGNNEQQDRFCGTNTKFTTNSKICWFGLSNRNTPITPAAGAMMGNFDAFTGIKHASASNPLGPLQKIVSIGGFGHDATFEDTFMDATSMANFVNSTVMMVKGFGLNGVDLDYEDPNMTPALSKSYLALIIQLRHQMPDKIITVTMLADPQYLKGTRGKPEGSQPGSGYGFFPGVLKQIASLVNHVDLMTYDFHGAFDYNKEGTGKTGFLTNLYKPSDAPAGYKFSVDASVGALLKQGLSSDKITVGIPAYGRSLDNVNPANGGLFQPLTSNTAIPRGDLDLKNCDTAITSSGPNTCGGMFNYNYILHNMVGHGFAAVDHQDALGETGASNGTTAFAGSWTPPAPAGNSLELINSSSSVIAFNVSVGSFTAPAFFTAGTDKSYASSVTAGISGQSGLAVNWFTSWGLKGSCPSVLNFTSNKKVTITVTAVGTGEYKTQCTYS